MDLTAEPVFCLTSDLDWASDYALSTFLSCAAEYGIRPTLFATHASPILDEFLASGAGEVGIHPNFLPGSSHGDGFGPVLDHVLRLFPRAEACRSHHFFDASGIVAELRKRGIRYDSNLCLYLQPGLVPLRHALGLTRFPVFWEDDCHWLNTDGDWNLDAYLPAFLTPGLKILNVHPFFFTANIPNQDYYLRIKPHITTVSADTVAGIRYPGAGLQTFLRDLMDALASRNIGFYSLGELYRLLPINNSLPATLPNRRSDRKVA